MTSRIASIGTPPVQNSRVYRTCKTAAAVLGCWIAERTARRLNSQLSRDRDLLGAVSQAAEGSVVESDTSDSRLVTASLEGWS